MSIPLQSALDAVRAEEQRLISGLQAGDEKSFEEIVRQYGGRLLAVARRLLGEEGGARDAVQETFLSAYRNSARFAGSSRLSTWLHKILVNAVLMKLRRRKRKPEEAIDDLLPKFRDDGHQVGHPCLLDWQEPAGALLEQREVRLLVRQSIERLPESYRTVLVLREIEELGTADVAGMLGLSENAVKVRLHRARQALRGLLDPHLRKAG